MQYNKLSNLYLRVNGEETVTLLSANFYNTFRQFA